MDYDAIVIGGGLGGLTAGAKLAKEGRKVLLIEQHIKPGGCATTFRRRDFVFDVSLIETEGLDSGDLKTNIFEDLGVFKNVEFLKLPELFRFIKKGLDVVMPYNTDKALTTLIKRFPGEEKGIRKYFRVIQGIREEVFRFPKVTWKKILFMPLSPILYPNIVFHQNMNVGDFLDSIVKNEDLKLLLQANLFFCHDDPYTMSLLWFAAAQGGFFSGGGHFIKGGSQNLSDYLAQFIRDNDGKVLLGHIATKIQIEGGKAVGVEFRKTHGEAKDTERASARNIIANAAIPTVANQLLPEEESHRLRKRIEGLRISSSVTSVYLGFRKSIRELGNKCYCTIVYDDSINSLTDLRENLKSDFTKKHFAFVDYSLIDSQLAPEGKSIGVITTVDYISNWEDLVPDEYRIKKENASRSLMERLNKLLPGISDEIEYYEAETPMTIRRFTLNPEGAAFGYAQTPGQAGIKRIGQKSPVKNLYFASAWTQPGGNYTGAILSGYFCAQEILRK